MLLTGYRFPVRRSLGVLMAVSALALGSSPARADRDSIITTDAVHSWLTGGVSCTTAFQGTYSEGSRCVANRLSEIVANEALRLVNDHGRTLLGNGYGVFHSLSWSPFDRGVTGDLDVTIPLASSSGVASLNSSEITVADSHALFFQHGVTRWTDENELHRNDLRHGTVYRFGLSESGILGLSTFFQENLERGHQRLVAGIDYTGQWGESWLQHHVPLTDWRPGRAGYEERVLAGTELGLRLDMTTTLSVDAAMARWDSRNFGYGHAMEGQVGLGWRPHPWLELNAGWGIDSIDGRRLDEDSGNFRIAFTMPLGYGSEVPRWEGLGDFNLGTSSKNVADTALNIWRPVDSVGRIEVAEREVLPPDNGSENSGDSGNALTPDTELWILIAKPAENRE